MKNRYFLGISLCLLLWITSGGILTGAKDRPLSVGPDRKAISSHSATLAGSVFSQQKRARIGRIEERPKRDELVERSPNRETWVRTYGDPYSDYATAVQTTADGGYIVAGRSRRQTDVTIQEALILKLSSNGEIEWQYAYSGVDEASSIRQTPDGGYIVSGTTMITYINDADFWLLKLSPGGIMEWQRVYGGDENEWANSVWPTEDGGYVVAGTTESLRGGDMNAWILKLSSSGEIEWQRSYGGADDEVVECIRQTSDGGYITAGGRVPWKTGLGDFLVQKLTSTGDVEWQRAYGDDWDDMAHSILQTSDGGYLVAGEVGQMIAVLKLSPSGRIVRQRVFWNAKGLARSVKETIDGGFVIAGTVNTDVGGDNISLLKFSSAGDLEWQKIYGGMRNDAQGVDIEQHPDGAYVVAGYTQAFGMGESDVLILRLDSEGQIERFPEISVVSHFQLANFPLVVQDITSGSRRTAAAALSADIPYYAADKKTWLIFSPPYLSGKRVLNRSLSQAEYVDVLTWEPNPNNSDLHIVSYRLYLDDSYHGERRLADINPNQRTFLVRDVAPDAWHIYSLRGVTDKGEEGMRRFITIKDTGW